MKLLDYYNYLVKWVQESVKNAKCDGVIVGLSGGIDSSVVAAIAKDAFPNNSLGLIMPIESSDQDLKDAISVVQKLDLSFEIVDLNETFKVMTSHLPVVNKLAIANIKPRLRMTTLYAFAQEKKYLVLGTDNMAEMFLGYFTKYGDGGVDLLPIVHLTKMEVFELAKLIGIPQQIIEKKPSAGLWENQEDEQELGFSYEDFDNYVYNKSSLDRETIKKIELQHQITEHKRKSIPQPEKFLK
ncbi:NAD(+) synthase [Mycoplasma iguanae]|uniref:NH(3)-dependent NAD(+) synthetase n=1 Tax=Mycoplasma iguanae TaxID=292461 RepID=A0ABY5R9J1_9MOLU|nr:NAD(+) synthase [Mycoplasma iguanae]UVD81444.1 NAD(+) synthase [Mycoplasma iguanae]